MPWPDASLGDKYSTPSLVFSLPISASYPLIYQRAPIILLPSYQKIPSSKATFFDQNVQRRKLRV